MHVMLSIHDVHWLAGLLEGEGCFSTAQSKSPIIQLAMTDQDVVERAGILMGSKTLPKTQDRSSVTGKQWKRQWKFGLYGNRAAGWMMTLYPLLGTRRRARIREVLAVWRSYQAHQKDREFCKNGHALTGTNVLAAQWRSRNGVRHLTARRCRLCFNAYVKEWRHRRSAGKAGQINGSDGTTPAG